MANVLKRDKQETIIKCLVDGSSFRAVERITDVHRDTIMRLMVRVGEGCGRLMDEEMRNLKCNRIEVDEIWSFVGKKQNHLGPEDDKRRLGEFWTYVALDPETKLIPSFLVGKRDAICTMEFLRDLSERLDNRIQLSADGWKSYVDAAWFAFDGKVDFAQIVKTYEAEPIGPGRYAPPNVASTSKTVVWGSPDPKLVSTSYVERQNLTMRQCMRRLTRLTLGFSKKLENHKAATALHFAYYNYCRMHKTLKATPAMAGGVAFKPWSVADLMDAALASN